MFKEQPSGDVFRSIDLSQDAPRTRIFGADGKEQGARRAWLLS
jgi:hypothetical protein